MKYQKFPSKGLRSHQSSSVSQNQEPQSQPCCARLPPLSQEDPFQVTGHIQRGAAMEVLSGNLRTLESVKMASFLMQWY
jgi:hypothetical protein